MGIFRKLACETLEDEKKRHGGVAKDIFAWHENEKVIIFMALSAGNIKTVFLEKERIYREKKSQSC